MAKFDVDSIRYTEDLDTTTVLIPEGTTGIGKVISKKVTVKVAGDDSKNPGSVWARLTLMLAFHDDEGKLPELFETEEVNLPYTPFVRIGKNGLPLKAGNEQFAKLLESVGISLKDRDLYEGIDELDSDNFADESAMAVEATRLFWENLGAKFLDMEFKAKTGIDKGFGDEPMKTNIIARIAPLG